MTVREVLESARESSLELRRIRERAEIMREAIGVQGHNSLETHAKVGILDPMRRVVELIEWQEQIGSTADLEESVEEARELLAGAAKVSDAITAEVASRYYVEAESWVSICRDLEQRGVEPLPGMRRDDQSMLMREAMNAVIDQWERIGMAHLKEMGRS